MMAQPTREELEAWDRQHVWHAFTQMAHYEPLVIERAQGARLTDIHGRDFLDGVSSLWCNVHGHRHPHLDAALRAQLDKVAHTTSLGASNSTTITLAKQLVDRSPAGLEHVFFSSDGASSIEAALKIAFQYCQQSGEARERRTRFAALGCAYHGDTLGSVSVGGVDRFHTMFGPLLFDVVRVPAPEMHRLPPGITEALALEYYVDQANQVLAAHHEELAALIVEPIVQGAAGLLVHPPGYLQALRELTRKYDILLIADEVAVGFGRTGTLFACEQEQVTPDLLCMGKGLTGGYLPMAATLATDEVYEAFLGDHSEQKQFFHGHTYGGNPLAAAVALASLELFDQEQTLEHLPEKAARLAEHLARLAEHPHVGDVRQRGLIAGIELVEDRETQQPFPWQQRRGAQVCQHAMDQGVWLRPLGDVIVVMPPLSIRLDELDQIMQAVTHGICQATEAGKAVCE